MSLPNDASINYENNVFLQLGRWKLFNIEGAKSKKDTLS